MRVASAVVLAPVALLCLWTGGAYWGALAAVAGTGLALEWVALCGRSAASWPGFGALAAVVAAALFASQGRAELGVAALLVGAGLMLPPRGWMLAAGVLYAGLGTVALVWLRGNGAVGRANVVFVIAVVWASDIGAYLAGRLLGGPRMAPLISPGKTWSGAVGGLLIAMAVGTAVAQAAAPGAPLRAAVLAGLLAAASQAGDLAESAVKRRSGVKDSGQLIPGHGGLLDRLDGLLAAAPTAAGLELLIGGGALLWH